MGAVRTLMEHYEEVGDRLLHLLAQENTYSGRRAFTDAGRAAPREWVERTFAPFLAGATGQERTRLLAELVAITDVWALLRRDMGLGREQAELALREMLAALLEQGGS